MSVHEYLMQVRHDDRLRSAAQQRLAKQVRLAQTVDRDAVVGKPSRRRWLFVPLRRVPGMNGVPT